MNNYNPPIAKTVKKNSSTIMISSSKLIAEKREANITLRGLILDIVLKGLKTLKTLNEFKLPLYPPPS